MPPLTAAQVQQHPAYQTAIWDLPPAKAGKVAVAEGRGGPINISYEIHGSGPAHLVWVMGLGTPKTAWQRQVKRFGHDQASKYSCLIFDNRGMGGSDKPLLRYSTSEMAKDVFDLLDQLRWTSKRQLHLIGVSMGGMIVQEMAYLQPQRIASLSLVSTASRLVNTVGWLENIKGRINMFIPKDINATLADVRHRVFSQEFLDQPDMDGEFPTNADRFAAQELRKRSDTEAFTQKGFMLQAIAAGWHHKSAGQLKQIGDSVGRERIQVLHGTVDRMITFPHGEVLVEELGGESGGVRWVIFEGKGHVLHMEAKERFGQVIAELVAKTEAL